MIRGATVGRSIALAIAALSGCLSYHSGALPDEPRDARFAEVRGARIRYVDEGEGPPVVLIHGFASSMENWRHVRPVLRRNHRVIALDLKGFGFSDRPEGDYSPEEQARIVLALMDDLRVERAAVVGHSWGASIALSVALQAPHRVTRLALYDAWAYEEQLPTFFHWAGAKPVGEVLFAAFYDERPEDRIARAFHDPATVDQSVVDDVEAGLARPGTRAAALAAVRGMQYHCVQDRYTTIEHPVLLLWGREDTVTPLEYGERLASELPNADLVVFPRCGHFPMLEAKNASTRALARFLRGDLE